MASMFDSVDEYGKAKKVMECVCLQLANLQEQFSKLSAEVGIARNQVEAMEIPRPKSVVHRPKTPGQNQTKVFH